MSVSAAVDEDVGLIEAENAIAQRFKRCRIGAPHDMSLAVKIVEEHACVIDAVTMRHQAPVAQIVSTVVADAKMSCVDTLDFAAPAPDPVAVGHIGVVEGLKSRRISADDPAADAIAGTCILREAVGEEYERIAVCMANDVSAETIDPSSIQYVASGSSAPAGFGSGRCAMRSSGLGLVAIGQTAGGLGTGFTIPGTGSVALVNPVVQRAWWQFHGYEFRE